MTDNNETAVDETVDVTPDPARPSVDLDGPGNDSPSVDSPNLDSPIVDSPCSPSNDAADVVLEPGALDPAAVDHDHVQRVIEAILMITDEAVRPEQLAGPLQCSEAEVRARLEALSARLIDERRGFVLVRAAGGYRFQTDPALAADVERFVLDGQAARLSAAAMETLAIVAYKQPISRAQVASIRGVNVDGVMKTLVQRGYVAEVGVDPGPGQASLFGTTTTFLQKLGLDTIDQLPPIGDLVPGAEVMDVLEASLSIDGETGRPIRSSGRTAAVATSPESSEPESSEPESSEPESSEPETSEPETSESETSEQ